MKIYVLVYEQDTDCGCDAEVSTFIRKEDAQATMRAGWEESVESWEYNSKEHKDEDECYCEEESAVIRDGMDSVRWHIEEHDLDVQVAVRVKGGLVDEVHANADVNVDVYDLDVSDFPDEGEQDEADKKEAELDELVKAPGWRAVWYGGIEK